jgi:hypothetical protein
MNGVSSVALPVAPVRVYGSQEDLLRELRREIARLQLAVTGFERAEKHLSPLEISNITGAVRAATAQLNGAKDKP